MCLIDPWLVVCNKGTNDIIIARQITKKRKSMKEHLCKIHEKPSS